MGGFCPGGVWAPTQLSVCSILASSHLVTRSTRRTVKSSHGQLVTDLTETRMGLVSPTAVTYPFIATQLNSTSSWVVLSCVGEVSLATPTQLNSTRLTCFALIGCTLFNWVSCIADRRRQLSCVGEGIYSDATQLNSTSSWVVSL